MTDDESYAQGAPYELWRTLRRTRPVSWQQTSEGQGHWAVVTHSLGARVLREWQSFTVTRGTFLRPDLTLPFPGSGKMPALTDPPRHTVLRRAAAGLFTPRATAAFEERAREVVAPLVRAAVGAGECEFIRDIAGRVPLAISGDLLGISADEAATMSQIADRLEHYVSDVDSPVAQGSHVELLMYYDDLLAQRRHAPGKDLVSTLLAAQAAGAEISDEEIVLICDNVIAAASDTTKYAAGNAIVTLLEQPDSLAQLRTGSVDIADAVEELVRWDPPLNYLLRTAVTDVELAGAMVRSGEALTVWIPSANRDETVFDDPDTLRLDRRPNPHLGYGVGVHHCLGAPMARLILRALLTELMVSVGDFRLAGPTRRLASCVFGGYTEVPLTLRAASPPSHFS
ncbi:MAG TPA: cytochrome P450 [Jatrophihabitans sp.]|jgi:cytochrome P450|uniref:cytochrome P450 n=1 Tax=Jatrophihabitans sp. TaxID=1932789 RepID=UPI002F0BCC4F